MNPFWAHWFHRVTSGYGDGSEAGHVYGSSEGQDPNGRATPGAGLGMFIGYRTLDGHGYTLEGLWGGAGPGDEGVRALVVVAKMMNDGMLDVPR